ncbi:MAG: hypothetical protein WCK39_00415 [Methanomassiliicoccales archaeon]
MLKEMEIAQCLGQGGEKTAYDASKELSFNGWLIMHKSNARNFSKPCTNNRKQVDFARLWPNRYRAFLARRDHSETVFSMVGSLFRHA